MSVPEAGNHHDLFEIKTHFGEILASLTNANISVDGLFINADSGLDSKELRNICEQNSLSLTLLKTSVIQMKMMASILMNYFIKNGTLLNVLMLG